MIILNDSKGKLKLETSSISQNLNHFKSSSIDRVRSSRKPQHETEAKNSEVHTTRYKLKLTHVKHQKHLMNIKQHKSKLRFKHKQLEPRIKVQESLHGVKWNLLSPSLQH